MLLYRRAVWSRTLTALFVPAVLGVCSGLFPVIGSAEGSGHAGRSAEVSKLVPADADAEDFGRAISMHRSRIVVGAPGLRRTEVSGAAYVFERAPNGGWQQVARLVADEGAAYDRFGASVAIKGGRLAIGVPGDGGLHVPGLFGYTSGPGAVYVYRLIRRTGDWSLEAKLTPSDAPATPDGELGHVFGSTVAFVRGGLAIGAPGDDVATGAVYIFKRKGRNWLEEAKLVPAEGNFQDSMGHTLAAQGKTVVTGAAHTHEKGRQSGAAYVFEQIGGVWSQTARLTASDNAELINFGSSVAIRGGVIAVGAPGGGTFLNLAGAAYVFGRQGAGWAEQAKLVSSDVEVLGGLGRSISVGGGRVLVGAPLDQNFAGTAFVFGGASWADATGVLPDDLVAPANYGWATATFGRTMIVSAPIRNAVYVYE